MEWKAWQNLPLPQRAYLPSCSGVYVVADIDDFVWYVGQATNLRNRWIGKSHHRYPQLLRSNRKRNHRLYWKPCAIEDLNEQEQYYIKLFAPELNWGKVKTYLPKQTKQLQVDCEIKRLLKVLNHQTLLFPTVRSIIAGEFDDEDGRLCILILVHSNDFEVFGNSARKKSREIKNAWSNYKTYSGKSEEIFYEQLIPVYSVNGQRFIFVEASEIIYFFEDNPDILERCVKQIELFDVQVKILDDLTILDTVPIEEEYSFIISGKKTLRDTAYLNYRKHLLKRLNLA